MQKNDIKRVIILRLVALRYGSMNIPLSWVYLGEDKNKTYLVSMMFFLVEHGDKKILVDTGCDYFEGYDKYDFKTPVDILGDYGIKPEEITDIIITHPHDDHIASACHFADATVYLHKDAFEYGKRFLENNKNVQLIEDGFKLTDEIEVRHIGGHCKGSCVVVIKHGGKKYVLCGDECYSTKNFIDKIPTGASICPEKSKAFVEEYSDLSYTPVVTHDIDLVKEFVGFKTIE